MIVVFQTRLEQIFEQPEFLWFCVKRRHRPFERFRQFRDSAIIVIEIGWIGVPCQLLKKQQNLVCFNCRRSILTAKLRLTWGARLLLFAWRNSRRAVGNFFLRCCHIVRIVTNLFWTSCHHMRVIFGHHRRVGFCLWAIELKEWWGKYPTSGWGSSEERSPWVSQFSESTFLDVPFCFEFWT